MKSLVDHYFMSQSHVGDTFSSLHQLLHRDKPGRAGCEGGKNTPHQKNPYQCILKSKTRNQTFLLVEKKSESLHSQQTGFEQIFRVHYLLLPRGLSMNVEQAHTWQRPDVFIPSSHPVVRISTKNCLFSTPALKQNAHQI